MERSRVTLATGVSGHVSDRTGKDKETLKSVLVEKPERTDVKGVQGVNWEARASEFRSRRVWIGKSKAASENKTYDSIVIISLLRILLIKTKHHYLSFPLRPIKLLHTYTLFFLYFHFVRNRKKVSVQKCTFRYVRASCAMTSLDGTH